jgi:gluconolactonase
MQNGLKMRSKRFDVFNKTGFLLLVWSSGYLWSCQSKPRDIVAAGAEPVKISGEFKFTEGPASDSEGNVFFTDQPNDRIMKYDVTGELTTWMQPAGRANGLCFDAHDNLWACADEKNELWIINKQKEVTVLLDSYNDAKLNGPNDIWVAPDGSAFFTDPFYKRPWWDRDSTQQDGQCVYYLPPVKADPTRVIDDLKQPNGIIGTPDGKKLYVADIGDNKTYSYDIGPEGDLSNKKVFCEKGSDGMTIDEDGNLYLTHRGGVFVFNSEGQQIKLIEVDEPWTANVCFGGEDMKTLFITAQTGFYSVRMNVKGVGSQ